MLKNNFSDIKNVWATFIGVTHSLPPDPKHSAAPNAQKSEK